MNELEICQKAGPPATVEELSRFLLIAPERVSAMQAEIRAIKKAGLAAEVYLQKVREQQRLCELVLDASVRMGDIAKSIAKASGGDRRSEVFKMDTAAHFENVGNDTPKNCQQQPKGKLKTFEDLGFSPKQVQRFETLADNVDLVELEKETARKEGRMPTRTNVIDMAKARKDRFDRDMEQIDSDAKIAKAFVHAVHAPLLISEDPAEIAAAIWRNASGNVQGDIADIDVAVTMLSAIKTNLLKGGNLYGSY